MYASVKTAFSSFTNTFEGRIHWMYADVKGLVTTGVGNLIEPVAAAVALPFQHANGVAATAAEITAAWQDIKNNGLTLGAAGANACATRNDLRLTDAAIDNLVSSKLASNEATFLRSFPDFESWPADAQLAGMSMSWALGPAFAPSWPKLSAALKAKDWKTAAANCSISTTGNAGVAPRNVADQALFTNAAAVAASTADPSVLYYPGTVPAAAAGTSQTGSSQAGSSQAGSSQAGSSQAGSSQTGSSPTSSSQTGSSKSGGSTPASGGTAAGPTGAADSTSDEPGSGEDSPSEETDPSSPDASSGDSTGSDTDATDNPTSDSAGDDPSGDDTTDSSNADSTDSDGTNTDASGDDNSDTGSSADDTSDTGSSGDDSSDTGSSGDDTSDTGSSGDDGSGAPGDDSSGSGSSDDDGGS
jgi:GH24 family phage-related lysozyme (muramidase)